ncbi:MAG: ATP-binding protein, partial [Actinomycetota bacterium]
DSLSRDLYYRITPLARTRFARLAFQPGAGVSVRGADLIVLHARGLVLPSKEEVRTGDDLDASKAASIAMVYLLMALADAIGNVPDRLSSIILDEAWAFLDSSFGIDLANRVLRDGRKDFKKLQLWSQHPADAPPDLLNMASNVFLTRQVEGAGAAALRMVGAEPTPELVSMVEQLDVGDMVMRDEYGRLGVIHVAPPVDPRTARAFDTRPRSGQGAFAEWEPAIEDVLPLPDTIDALPEAVGPEPDLVEPLPVPVPVPAPVPAPRPEPVNRALPERVNEPPLDPVSAPPARPAIEATATTVTAEHDGSDFFARLEASLAIDDEIDQRGANGSPGPDGAGTADDHDGVCPGTDGAGADGDRRLDLTSFTVPRD